jgi:hypothetical protein
VLIARHERVKHAKWRYSVAFAVAVCCCFVLFPVAADASTPHATAKSLLSTCYRAVSSLSVRAVTLNSPDVPRMNRAAARVNRICSAGGRLSGLAYTHQKDKALEDARLAYFDLSLGIGDYVQYLVDAAFGKNNRIELRRAISETASGRALAVRALRELG